MKHEMLVTVENIQNLDVIPAWGEVWLRRAEGEFHTYVLFSDGNHVVWPNVADVTVIRKQPRHRLLVLPDVNWGSLADCINPQPGGVACPNWGCPRHDTQAYAQFSARHKKVGAEVVPDLAPRHRNESIAPLILSTSDLPSSAECTPLVPCPNHHPKRYAEQAARHRAVSV